jgi:hypothetical protein
LTSTSSILAKHIHSNDDPHKLTAINETTVRCWSCQHTLDLTPKPASVKSTSTSFAPLNINDKTACPEHSGQLAGSCGPCRSELIGSE